MKTILAILLILGAIQTGRAQSHWSVRHPVPTPYGLLDATYGDGQFVAVGYYNTVITSPDGVNWNSRLPEADFDLTGVAYGDGRFVVVGAGLDHSQKEPARWTVLVSMDGVDWQSHPQPPGIEPLRLVFANGLFIGFGRRDYSEDVVLTSPDGRTWTERWRGEAGWSTFFTNKKSIPAAAGNGLVLAQSVFPQGFLISKNGMDWSLQESVPGFRIGDEFWMAYGNGEFLVTETGSNVAEDGLAWLSRDGINWERVVIPSAGSRLYDLCFGGGRFVCLALRPLDRDNGIGDPLKLGGFVSADGRNWSEAAVTGLPLPWEGGIREPTAFVASKDTFILTGQRANPLTTNEKVPGVFSAPDGLNWTRRVGSSFRKPGIPIPQGAAGDRGQIALLGLVSADGETFATHVLKSDNGRDWNEAPPLPEREFYSIAYGNDVFVAAGNGGIFTTPDGSSWTRQPNTGIGWHRLRFSGGRFFALDFHVDNNPSSFGATLGISSNGSAWAIRSVPNIRSALDAASDGTAMNLIAVDRTSGHSKILHSADGQNWIEVYQDADFTDYSSIAHGGGRYVALSAGSHDRPDDWVNAFTSTDGVNWTKQLKIFRNLWGGDLIQANGQFFAAGWDNSSGTMILLSSADGLNWVVHRPGFHIPIGTLAAGPAGIYAFSFGGEILESPWDLVLELGRSRAGGPVTLQIHGSIGQNVTVEATPSLSPVDWRTIWTDVLTAAPTTVPDSAAGEFPSRFYRAKYR